MDRKIQLTTIVLLFSFLSFAQCDTTKITTIKDSCTYVLMSPEKFAEFLTAYQQVDKLRNTLAEIDKNTQGLKESMAKEQEIENEFKEMLVENDRIILSLRKEVRKEKRKRNITIVAAIVLTLLICSR